MIWKERSERIMLQKQQAGDQKQEDKDEDDEMVALEVTLEVALEGVRREDGAEVAK